MESGGLQVEIGFFLAAGDDLHWPEPKARRRRSLTPAPAHRLPPLFRWPTVCKVTQISSEQFWNLSPVIADGCRFEVPSFDGIYLQFFKHVRLLSKLPYAERTNGDLPLVYVPQRRMIVEPTKAVANERLG